MKELKKEGHSSGGWLAKIGKKSARSDALEVQIDRDLRKAEAAKRQAEKELYKEIRQQKSNKSVKFMPSKPKTAKEKKAAAKAKEMERRLGKQREAELLEKIAMQDLQIALKRAEQARHGKIKAVQGYEETPGIVSSNNSKPKSERYKVNDEYEYVNIDDTRGDIVSFSSEDTEYVKRKSSKKVTRSGKKESSQVKGRSKSKRSNANFNNKEVRDGPAYNAEDLVDGVVGWLMGDQAGSTLGTKDSHKSSGLTCLNIDEACMACTPRNTANAVDETLTIEDTRDDIIDVDGIEDIDHEVKDLKKVVRSLKSQLSQVKGQMKPNAREWKCS